MALISALTDNFPGSSFNAGVWTNSLAGTIVVASNQCRLAATTSYCGLATLATYDCTGGTFLAMIVPDAGINLPSVEFGLQLNTRQDFNTSAAGTYALALMCIDGTLKLGISTNGTFVTFGATTYNATTHKWLRIRISGTTVFADYSADGASWSNYTSQAFTFPSLTAMYAGFVDGYDFSPTTNNVYWTNVNLPTSVSNADAPSGRLTAAGSAAENFTLGDQILRPSSDIATAGWTNTPLFSKINDSSDGTFITATLA